MAARMLRVAVVALGIVAVAPLTWWVTLALPIDEHPSGRLEHADYMWNPPGLSGTQRLGIGLISLAAVAAGLLVLADGLRVRGLRRGWLGVVTPLIGVAALAGLTYRMATAPVTGANIGGGLMVLATFAVVPVLMVQSLLAAARLR